MLLWSTLSVISYAASGAQEQPRSASDLLAKMDAAAAALQDYEVTGDGETDGKPNHFTLYFKSPNLVRIDSKEGQVSVQPNGDIRGRLGHGPFGKISQKLSRDDEKLKDSEGIPFYDSHFAATISRIKELVKGGATAKMTVKKDGYSLVLKQDTTFWRYEIDPKTWFFMESARTVNGKRVEITRYSGFKPNTGIKTDHFKF